MLMETTANNTFIGIIPARYASTRFPGKPLAMIGNKTMIQHVYEKVKQTLDNVIVATDDEKIFETVQSFGGKAMMTSPQLPNGTARCAETIALLEKQGIDADVVINIQGDEPFIHPKQIEEIMQLFADNTIEIATQIKIIETKEDLFNPNIPKVVVDNKMQAIYFSRSPIPYLSKFSKEQWLNNHTFYKHIGMYAYRKKVLMELINLSPTANETAESLEQLRWIDNGYKIKTTITTYENIAIDTPEDLSKIPSKWLKK